MRIRHITFALSALALAGLGFEAAAQQKPVTAARAATAQKVVVYKSPT